MDFHKLTLNTDEHKYVRLAKIPSVMSFSYLSKFDLQNLKPKTLQYSNSIPCTTLQNDLIDFVPNFNTANSTKLPSEKFQGNQSASTIRKFNSCPQLSTMNILSYLVGGFVGSKSQVGVASMQGYRFQIWDLILQKLLDIMDDENEKNEKLVNLPEQQTLSKSMKQSYAEVTKTKVPIIATHKPVRGLNENMRNTKKSQRVSTYYSCKEKTDFKSDKKSLQDMDCFNSSRWSNSRRKNYKKGLEKRNKRYEREAAKDGLEFINEELDKNINSIACRTYSLKRRTSYNNSKNKNKDQTIDAKVPVFNFHNIEEQFTNDEKCQLDVGKTNLKHDGLLTATYNRRHSISSVCSVESDDSFIVFDRTADDYTNLNVFTEICYNSFDLLQTDDDSNDSDSSDCSTSDGINVSNNNCTLHLLRKENVSDNSRSNINSNNIPCNLVSNTTRVHQDAALIFTNLPYSNESVSQKYMKSSEEKSQLLKCRSLSESSADSDDSFITFEDSCSSPMKMINDMIDYDKDFHGVKSSCFIDFEPDKLNCLHHLSASPYVVEVVKHYGTKSWLKNINAVWKESINKVKADKRKVNNTSKKVQFAPENKLVTVKKLVVWDFALRAARIGPWEEYARDTMRFHDRIHRVSGKLQWVFDPTHRNKIWNERFAV